MNNQQIIKELCNFLPPATLAELQIISTLKGANAVCLCGTVNNVIHTYKDTQVNEDRVATLLANFCKNHFRENTTPTGWSEKKINDQLKIYLPNIQVIELGLSGVLTGKDSILVCASVSKITSSYNTPQYNHKVLLLLGAYCRNHFNKKAKTIK